MAFKLKQVDDEIFSTPAGGTFTIELSANRGAVQLLSARYGSQHSTENPKEFDVEAGVNDLIILFQATNNDALVRLDEVDGNKKQRLTSRPAFDGSLSIEIRTQSAALAKKAAKKKAAKKASKNQ